jgi:hypothetical protein
MAIDEAGRLRLHRRLEEVLGVNEAEVLMAQLPVRGWADVATKDDIAALRAEMRSLAERFDVRTSSLEERLSARLTAKDHRFTLFEERQATSEERLTARLTSFEDRTNARLAILEEHVSLGFRAVDDRIRGDVGGVEHRLAAQARAQFVAYLTFVVAFAAVLVAALRVH